MAGFTQGSLPKKLLVLLVGTVLDRGQPAPPVATTTNIGTPAQQAIEAIMNIA